MLYTCQSCGARIAGKVLLEKIDDLRRENLISREVYAEARKKLESEVSRPYIRCHVPGCQGVLEAEE